jgi:hypothetical protein
VKPGQQAVPGRALVISLFGGQQRAFLVRHVQSVAPDQAASSRGNETQTLAMGKEKKVRQAKVKRMISPKDSRLSVCATAEVKFLKVELQQGEQGRCSQKGGSRQGSRDPPSVRC